MYTRDDDKKIEDAMDQWTDEQRSQYSLLLRNEQRALTELEAIKTLAVQEAALVEGLQALVEKGYQRGGGGIPMNAVVFSEVFFAAGTLHGTVLNAVQSAAGRHEHLLQLRLQYAIDSTEAANAWAQRVAQRVLE